MSTRRDFAKPMRANLPSFWSDLATGLAFIAVVSILALALVGFIVPEVL